MKSKGNRSYYLCKIIYVDSIVLSKNITSEKSIDELITNAILEVDYGQSSAEDALTSLAQKLNENIASNYQ